MPIETYPQALDFWFRRINYEQRGMPTDLREWKLDRMRALLDRLGHPEERLRIIHIAGSKGKGSTAAMLASILQQAGYRTGLFTSPHLSSVEERCQVNGQPISPEELTCLMRELEPVVRAVEAQEKSSLTFFEIVTALGFLHFARRRVDLAVVEVGLGGRFDSTNVCTPLVAVITSISYDHTQQLGTTLVSIAREKAGIIKLGRTTISGVTTPEARAVIEQVAHACHSRLLELGRDFHFAYQPGWVTASSWRWPQVCVQTWQRRWPELELALFGEHQAANAAVALACVEELRSRGLSLPEKAVEAGLRQVRWPARMEVLCRQPLVLLDCAHNVASVHALVETLQTTFPPARRGLVFACSRDKDLPGMLNVLVPHFEHAFFTRYTSSARGAAPADLAECWRARGGSCEIIANPADAWNAAYGRAGPDDMICITGSVFLAGELRPLLLARNLEKRQRG